MPVSIAKLVALLAAVIFASIGLGWYVAPEFIANQLGMTLLTGPGLSTQIADLASFFLVMAFCIAAGLRTGKAIWFYPAVLLLGMAAFGRLLAWAVHGAAFAADKIAVEIIIASVLFLLIKQSKSPREQVGSQ